MATSSLASLVVSLEANVAQFNTNIQGAAATTEKAMKGISSAIDGAKSQFLSLAASIVSVGAVMKSVKDAIDLGDELKTMSDATGIAVAKLDQLSIVAKLNNASLEDMARGFKGLGKSIIESQESTSKTGQLFRALGISVKDASGNLRGVDEVMGDVAKALNSIENETTRAAVGTALFGKSYLQIAASLRNFEEDQARANEVLEKFGGVSDQAAALADDLGDKLTLLGEGSKRALLSGLVPGLAAVGQAIQELINQGGSFQTSFGDVISNVASFVSQSLISLMGTFRVVGTTIAAVMASIATQSLQPLRDLPGEIAKIEAQVIGAQARIRTAAAFPGLGEGDQVSRAAAAQERLNKTVADSGKLAAILGAGAAKVDDFAKAMAGLAKDEIAAQASLDKLLGGIEAQVPALVKLKQQMEDPIWATWTDKQRALYEARAKDVAAIQQQELAIKKLLDQVNKEIEADEKLAEALQKESDRRVAIVMSYEEGNDRLAQENAIIGQSALAHALLAAKLEYETQLRNAGAEATAAFTEKLREDYEVRKRLITEGFQKTEFVAQWNEAFKTISDGLTDAIMRGFEAGGNFIKSFVASLKQLFSQLVLRPIIQAAIAPIAGGLAGLIPGTANAGGGTGGGLGNILSLFGGGSGPGFFGGLGNLAAGVGNFTDLLGQGVSITSAAAGAFTGLGSSLSAVLGPIGLVTAGATLLFNYLNSKKGGPMTREFGTSGAGIETFGDLSGVHKLDTGASSAAALETYAATTKGTYDGIVKALGGSGSAAFAIYTSQDPRGKAPNQLDVRSTVGGQAAYTANVENQLGRDPAVLQARLELEASRAVLGALQLSSFPKYLADLFNSIDASTATAEQISNIIAVAGAIKQAADLIPKLQTLDPATIQSIIDAVGGVQAFAQSVGFLAQNFSTATDKLDEAQTSLTAGFAELHLAVPQTHADFLALLDSFDLTTDSGRALYAAVLKLSGAFVEVKGTAEQAAEALKTSINALHEAQTSYTGIKQAPDNQAELTALLTTFIADKPWAQGLSTDALLSGIAQIHDDDFARYSPENQSLIVQIINVAAAIKNSTTTIANAIDDGTAASVAAYNAAEQRANTEATVAARLTASGGVLAQQRIDLFGTLAGQGGGDFGQRLALQIAYITTEIAKLESQRTTVKVAAEIKALQAGGAALAQTLTLYSTLSATYGGDVAEQLVAITATYKQQSKLLEGNAGALALLNASFETQWNAIINGTAAGVGGVQDELKRLQQSILDYVDSLRISTESPLTPTEKLAEARRQYETTLASAQGGDKKALGDITGSADAYIKLARDYYASSSAYTDIFNSITGQLTDLGTADLSAVMPSMNAADEALLNALPVGSKLMSAADMQAIIGWFGGTQTGAAESLTGISGDTGKRTGTWEDSWFVRPRVTAPSTDEGITAGTDTVATAVMETAIMTASAGTRDADRIIAAVDASGNKIIEALTVAKK